MNMLFLILFRYLDFSIISFVLCRAYILKKRTHFYQCMLIYLRGIFFHNISRPMPFVLNIYV